MMPIVYVTDKTQSKVLLDALSSPKLQGLISWFLDTASAENWPIPMWGQIWGRTQGSPTGVTI